MIEINSIFENESFDNALKCSILFKNCMITANKKNAFNIKSNIFISVKWCQQTNMFVGDSGTGLNRDKTGITLDQIKNNEVDLDDNLKEIYRNLLNFANASKEFYELSKNHKLIQNRFKCFVFNVCLKSKKLFPIGIFAFVKSKKREGIDSIKNKKIAVVNISLSLIEKIYSLFSNFFSLEHVVNNISLNEIKKEIQDQINKKENESLKHKKFNFKKDNFKYTHFKNNIKKESILHYYIIQDMSNKVLDIISLDCQSHIDNLIIYDQNLQKFIKIKKIIYTSAEDIIYKSYIPVLI